MRIRLGANTPGSFGQGATIEEIMDVLKLCGGSQPTPASSARPWPKSSPHRSADPARTVLPPLATDAAPPSTRGRRVSGPEGHHEYVEAEDETHNGKIGSSQGTRPADSRRTSPVVRPSAVSQRGASPRRVAMVVVEMANTAAIRMA